MTSVVLLKREPYDIWVAERPKQEKRGDQVTNSILYELNLLDFVHEWHNASDCLALVLIELKVAEGELGAIVISRYDVLS